MIPRVQSQWGRLPWSAGTQAAAGDVAVAGQRLGQTYCMGGPNIALGLWKPLPKDVVEHGLSMFVMFDMNRSSSMAYHYSIMLFVFPHWLSNLRCNEKHVEFPNVCTKIQLDKERQSIGKAWDLAVFDWIHWLGGTLKVASACLLTCWHLGTYLDLIDISDGWTFMKINKKEWHCR